MGCPLSLLSPSTVSPSTAVSAGHEVTQQDYVPQAPLNLSLIIELGSGQ